MKIITFANLKGGVGKTMVCYNVGGFLAMKGKRVLFIDADIQANLTENAGVAAKLREDFNFEKEVEDWDAPPKPVYRIQKDDALKNVGHILMWDDISPNDVVLAVPRVEDEAEEFEKNLSIIISDYSLRDTEENLPIAHKNNYYMRLKKWIKTQRKVLEANFDYILIDVGPYLSYSTYNALYASDEIYLVTDLSYNAYNGMYTFYQNWKKDCESAEMEVTIKGIIINKYNTRTTAFMDQHENYLKNTMKSKYIKVFENSIHESIPLRRSETSKPLAFRTDTATISSQGYKSFSALVEELLERGF